MAVLPYVYLTYLFISLYFLSLFIVIYIKNRGRFKTYPKPEKDYLVSFIVPAYNEEESIEESIKHIFDIDYEHIAEAIVVNDCSKDSTKEIVESLLLKYPKLKIINNESNLGKAGSLNKALKEIRGELVAVVDADSFPAKDSLKKMVGFFNNPKNGAVTCPVFARNRKRFFENLQGIEYKAISFARKLLEFVDAIYVTPGPLALYRRTALEDINGFDPLNMTEDIEATWHLAANGWDRKMSLDTYVSSTVPTKLKPWWIQRRRWNIGGLQCIKKYWGDIGKKGMLGWFIIPFFMLNLCLGLVGLGIFFYLFITRVISRFLLTQYSIIAGTPILYLDEIYITPSVLNYLGLVLFIFGLLFLLFTLSVLKEEVFRKQNILNIPFYMIVYLILYPLIMAHAIWYFFIGKRIWR